MIEEQLFQKHFVGRDGFIWWIGQVVDETKWRDNIIGYRVNDVKEIPGFNERYKVRIMGYHTANLDDLKDDELPWATVMYPVTAGSGGAAASSSAQLRQGTFVFGFFLDGEDAQQPVIMGVLGNNAQTSLEKKIPKIGFLPFSGYTATDTVPVYAIKNENTAPPAKQIKNPGKTGDTGGVERGVESSPQGQTSGTASQTDTQQKKDGDIPTAISKTTRCGRNDVKGIALDIQKLILLVENLTKLSGDFSSQLTNRVDKIQKRIKNAVDDAIEFVSSKIKNIVEAVRKSVIEKITDVVKKSFFLFFPNIRPTVKAAFTKSLDGVSCAINKIIQGLLKLVSGALQGLINKAINAPVCLAESVASNIIGQVAGFLAGVIDSILQPINALLQTVGAAASLAGQILSIIKKIFGLFSCEEELTCPTLDQWSIWQGAGNNSGPAVDIESVFNQAQSLGKSAAQAATDAAGAFNASNLSTAGLGVDLAGAAAGCDIGPVTCGAPTVSVFGSGGPLTVGNVIVGAAGEVLGVDIPNPGSGYVGDPTVSITDSCGTGAGVAAMPIMSGSPFDDGGLTLQKVAIVQAGTGYLSGPDGSEGGSGRTWKRPDQSYKKGSDGTYFPPVDPGTPIELSPGDVVKVPSPVITDIGIIPSGIEFPINQPIIITAPKPPITVEKLLEIPEIATLPSLDREQRETLINRIPELAELSPEEQDILINLPPTILLDSFSPKSTLKTLTQSGASSGGIPTYPVILELDEVIIKNPGFNYDENDPIIVEPSRGAVLKPIVKNGAVIGVKIEQTARGFDTRPTIYIDSNTGFNAELIPVFKVIDVGPNDVVPFGTNVISVVDCVGKHSSSTK